MLQLAKYLTGDDFRITKPGREPNYASENAPLLNHRVFVQVSWWMRYSIPNFIYFSFAFRTTEKEPGAIPKVISPELRLN